jgi:16S rRNA (uracil1498-N3)-methyltransferase
MGLPRFYVDTPLAPDTTVALPEPVTRHIHVLRLAVGDDVCLFDGSGQEFRARLDAITSAMPPPPSQRRRNPIPKHAIT